MAYGVTPEGFVLKRLPEIKSDIENDLIDIFGEVDTTPSSVFGQLTGVLAKPAADVWEGLEQTYHAAYPSSAEGIALDNVLDINNLQRKSATKTIVNAILEGDESTNILAGKQAKTSNDFIFELINDTTITKSNVVKTIAELIDYHDWVDYTITINGINVVKAALPGDTIESVATYLTSGINALDYNITATREDGVITIISDDESTSFSVDVNDTWGSGDDIIIQERWSPAIFRAVNAGPKICMLHDLDEIITPQVGWNSIDNLEIGQTGQDIETDAEARIRRLSSLKSVGASVLESIVARINNEVADVNNAVGYENISDIFVNERPPHSFEIIVEGGDPQEIANKIWELKPAGIQTCSTAEGAKKKEIEVTDSNGDLQTIFFSRPEPVYTFVKVIINEYYTEETRPMNWENLLKDAIIEYGNGLPLGKDIIPQRWYAPVYSIQGLGSVSIEHGISYDVNSTTPDETGWVSTTIEIDSTQYVVVKLDADDKDRIIIEKP